MDPTREQWGAIADVVEQKGHMPFFDVAYQVIFDNMFLLKRCTNIALGGRGLSIP